MRADPKGSSKVSIPLVRPYPILILALVMFAGCAAFFFNRASTNDRGLIINGLIHLDMGEADVFYAVLGALSAGMALMGALSIYHCARIEEFRILVGKRTIKLPSMVLWKGSAEVSVEIDRITAVEMQPPGKPVMLSIHTDDQIHRIQARWLPPTWPVQEVGDLIIARVRQARRPEEAAAPEGFDLAEHKKTR